MSPANTNFAPKKLILIFEIILLGVVLGEEKPYRFWPEYKKIEIEKCEMPEWISTNAIRPGWDFSLPAAVTPKSNAGLVFSRIFSLNDVPKLAPVNIKANPMLSIWVRWAELEPEEEKFQFDRLEKVIALAESKGYGVEIRPLTAIARREALPGANFDTNRLFAPGYLSKLNIPVVDPEKNEANMRIYNYDVTHPEFHRRYVRFVKALGNTGLLQRPGVKSIVVGYASPSFGDEGIGPKGMKQNELPEHVKERLDAWAEAAKGVPGKVLMCGECQYGFSKGFGTRGGFVEMYMYKIPFEALGQRIDAQGYLNVDESTPLILHGGALGEENEEYEEWWAGPKGRFGQTTESFSYRYFSASLRMLQMRTSIVLLNPFSLIPELTSYASLEMGRTVNDTPDVWCFLRENRMHALNYKDRDWEGRPFTPDEMEKGFPCKNFERWLYQRDSAGYETEAVLPTPMPVRQWMIQKDQDTDWIARKGRKIGFAVDDRFLPQTPQNVIFKISYYDGIKGSFQLVYKKNGTPVRETITTTGSDEIRTATIYAVASFEAKGFDYDFEIQSEEKVPISIVRVVKQ